ncbi:hypothetical protein [Halalkalicoccus jeotgali]|uniref:Uncharacterized protein n=1 Tax=Halalkalicoccus jeotgali (strain DSM 18796 / CECT 7217 / JCM 14584 / KCTC 4019 / B3) TaxID=795797 RepID=D8J501_HALJB|nr:hypothetical protein [Halalkalicoccus jeotgali]ADJ15618.1 hypothetical protein HacjB3_11175 [Halalkalicoccus jeotgali B3]ELY36304.1 hypothetical protein C497_11488 [Halalkalicoccus jeotgali B3]
MTDELPDPDRRSLGGLTPDLTTTPPNADARTDVGAHIRRSYARTLRRTVIRAVRDGYDGVDVSHTEIQYVGEGAGLDVWRAEPWTDDPPTLPAGRGRRYDFRYYDRPALLNRLERGEWPLLAEVRCR